MVVGDVDLKNKRDGVWSVERGSPIITNLLEELAVFLAGLSSHEFFVEDEEECIAIL